MCDNRSLLCIRSGQAGRKTLFAGFTLQPFGTINFAVIKQEQFNFQYTFKLKAVVKATCLAAVTFDVCAYSPLKNYGHAGSFHRIGGK